MAHQQRAEIFALPFAISALFCGYSLFPLRLCLRFSPVFVSLVIFC